MKVTVTFWDGGDHIHLIRNESTVEASTIAFQLIPQDQTPHRRRRPRNCHF